jgi:DNA repair protein RecO (recombination protein O)
MEWRDIGFVLAARRHGESALIVELLTAEHGRHAGLVRGGQTPRRRALAQPGNGLAIVWRGRLPEHLGSFDCELVAANAAKMIDDPDRLAALNAATALLLAALPEREPHPDLYGSFAALLCRLCDPILPSPASGEEKDSGNALPSPAGGRGLGWGHAGGEAAAKSAFDSPCPWAPAYVAWECDLLAALGYGLDLTRCAATGALDDLAYVSPRTGRAVSREAGAPYRDKLLPLPGFLWHDAAAAHPEPRDIVAGLALTRHFLLHHLLLPQGGNLPEARERLAERMRRYAAAGMIAPI